MLLEQPALVEVVLAHGRGWDYIIFPSLKILGFRGAALGLCASGQLRRRLLKHKKKSKLQGENLTPMT